MESMELNVVSLQDLCLLTVRNYLSFSNVWSIYRLVPYVHCPRIQHIVYSFICENFMDISHTDQFLALDEEEMYWVLDNQDIKVSEAAMLNSLGRWYKHSERQRESSFKRLLDKIHWSVVGENALLEISRKYQFPKDVVGLRRYLQRKLLPRFSRANFDDLIFQENLSNVAVLGFREVVTTPRNQLKNTDIFALWLPVDSIIFAMKYLICDADDEEIMLKKVIPSHGDVVFAFGTKRTNGRSNWSYTETSINVKLNYHTGTATYCSPLVHSLYSNTLCIHSGIFIYFIGGEKELGNYTQNMYRYDIVKDKWAEMQPTIYGHSTQKDCAAFYKERYLYVFGKCSSETYDTWTNTWTSLETPLDRFSNPGDAKSTPCAAVLNDEIFIFDIYVKFVFNPSTNKWRPMFRHLNDVAESCFGRIFLLYHIKHCFQITMPLCMMNSDCRVGCYNKKLGFMKPSLFPYTSYPHITVMSRRTRTQVYQGKYVQHISKPTNG